MADALYYWDGTTWLPVASGGGSGGAAGPVGPEGPEGPAGHSVEIYGPQAVAPPVASKGDMWLMAPIVSRMPAPPLARRTATGRRMEFPILSGGLTYRPGRYRGLKKRGRING